MKMKLQHFGYLMRRTDSLKKILILGRTESNRRRGQQRMRVRWHHWLNWHEFAQVLGVGDGQGSLAFFRPWGSKELDTTEQLNWTECLTYERKLTYIFWKKRKILRCPWSLKWAWITELKYIFRYAPLGCIRLVDLFCTFTSHQCKPFILIQNY